MTTKADITVREGERQDFLHQSSDGYPSGFAASLRAALRLSSCEQTAAQGRLPEIRAEYFQNGHLDASWRYEITRAENGGYTIRVLSWALNLEKPCDWSVLEFEIDTKRHVPIYEGSLEEFLAWSEQYDEDSEEAVATLQRASKI